MTGSSTIRNSVRMVGQVRRMLRKRESKACRSLPHSRRPRSSVQRGVDAFGQFAAHAFHARQFFGAGRRDAGETAEMLEQCRSALGADAADFLEPAFFAR